jgi:hypothetical protein
MDIPEKFGIDFLDWFRAKTEAHWAANDSNDWPRGTRWLNGLSSDEIAAVEKEMKIAFPPDYRLFLERLHVVESPASKADGTTHGPVCGHFYNWLNEQGRIRETLEWVIEGFEFDIESNDLWLPSWGDRPDSLDAQLVQIRTLIQNAPALVPIFHHRFLVADPQVAGNPVLSIYQTDIIVYGDDLRAYLLNEFSSILGMSKAQFVITEDEERIAAQAAIPFWGPFIG